MKIYSFLVLKINRLFFFEDFLKKFKKRLDVLCRFVYNVPVTARQRDKQA